MPDAGVRLARKRQSQAEQDAPDVLSGQPDHHVAEVDLRLLARAAGLRRALRSVLDNAEDEIT
jgi:hypothetical protein